MDHEKVQQYRIEDVGRVDIYLPENFDPDRSYPLVIFNDGEEVFKQNGWNMASTLDELIKEGRIRPVIGAAVYSEDNRLDWYIPYNDLWITQNWGEYIPSTDQYAKIIIDKMLPFVRDKYPVQLGETAIIGASLGGLAATWIGLQYPEEFTYSAGLSPSLWAGDYAIFDDQRDTYPSENKFWFDIGTREWNYYVPLYRALDQAGVIPGISSFYYEVPGATHTLSQWESRVRYPLILFYGPKPYQKESMEVVLECIPSQSRPGVYFRRMNPIITLTNSVRYSLAHRASYTLLEGGGELGSEGSFNKDPDESMQVRVTYMEFEELVEIPAGFCE